MEQFHQVKKLHDRLLFEVAFPSTLEQWKNANAELRSIADRVASVRDANRKKFQNSGISGSIVRAPFSLGLNIWLSERYGSAVRLVVDATARKQLVELLSITLDPVEQEMLHEEKLKWSYWTKILSVQKPRTLTAWILNAFQQLPGSTQTREQAFAQLGIETEWRMKSNAPTITTARIESPIEIQPEGVKQTLTIAAALKLGEPMRIALSKDEHQRLIDVARGVLCAQLRETDPCTYANPNEVVLYDMGGGIRIALYAMQPEMKQTLQSFIGYLAFKNGVPIAYGGGWVLDNESGFGVNIFPPFRGGGSTVIVCQLLRLYHFVFASTSFSVDPYQIGYGNEDGIKSGSFWFYYRLGFRPEEKELAELAEKEFVTIKRRKTYRTDEVVLRELSAATMRWRTPGTTNDMIFNTDALADRVTAFIVKNHNGNRKQASQDARRTLKKLTGSKINSKMYINRISVLLMASDYLKPENKKQIRKFIDTYELKSSDEIGYVLKSQAFPELFLSLKRLSETP